MKKKELFNYKQVNEKSFVHLRANAVLGSLSSSFSENIAVNAIYTIAGHFVVLLDDRKTFCVFDAVPNEPIGTDNAKRIVGFLKGEQRLDKDHKGIPLPLPGKKDDTFLLDSIAEGQVTNLRFDWIDHKTGVSLHLLIGTDEGILLIWRWEKERWNFLTKLMLGYISKSKVIKFAYSESQHAIYSLDISANNSYAAPSCKLIRRTITFTDNTVELGPTEVVETLKAATDLLDAVSGIWLLTEKSIWFHEFSSKTSFNNIEISKPAFSVKDSLPEEESKEEKSPLAQLRARKQRAFIEQIVSYQLHPSTKELVILEASGNIVVCSYQQNAGILACNICKLHDFSPRKPVKDFALLHQIIALCQDNNIIQFYDLATGNLLEIKQINNSKKNFKNFWKNAGFVSGLSKDMKNVPQFGFVDGYDGIWQITFPAISLLSERIESVKRAAQICQHWNLQKLQAKYLLEEATQDAAKDFQPKFDTCQELLPLLSNPALTIAILSEDSIFRRRFATQVDLFLNQFHPKSTTENYAESQSQRMAAMTSFHLYTSLNEALYPLLVKYKQILVRLDEISLECLDINNLQSNPEISKDISLFSLSREEIELAYFEDPKILFTQLEQELELDKIVSKTLTGEKKEFFGKLILRQFEFEDQHDWNSFAPFFDMVCTLYYAYKPKDLPAFLTFCETIVKDHNKKKNLLTVNVFQRSLQNFPPLFENKDYPNTIPSDNPFFINFPSDEQIDLRIQILCQLSKSTEALRLMLLNANRWDKAVQILSSRMNQDSEHYELFHIALSHCLATSPEKCQQLWKFMPRNFGLMPLFRIIKTFLPPVAEDQITAKEGEFSINTFYGQLKRMF